MNITYLHTRKRFRELDIGKGIKTLLQQCEKRSVQRNGTHNVMTFLIYFEIHESLSAGHVYNHQS